MVYKECTFIVINRPLTIQANSWYFFQLRRLNFIVRMNNINKEVTRYNSL